MLTNLRPYARITPRIRGPMQMLAVLAVIVALLLFSAACTPPHAGLTGTLPIIAPALANAGEQINVTVGPVQNARNGTFVGLVMLGTYGPRVYQAEFVSGLAHFIIPPEHTLQPGYLALIAAVDEARGEASIILFVQPTSLISVVEPLRLGKATGQIATLKP